VTTVIGQFPLQIYSSAQFVIESGPDWLLSAAVFGNVPTGTLTVGLHGTMVTGCGDSPSVCQSSGADGRPISITQNSSSFGNWDQHDVNLKSASVDVMDGFLGVDLNLVGSFGESIVIDDAATDTLSGRCDSIITPAECVDQFGPMAVVFDSTLNPAVAPVSQHIWNAEATAAPAPLPTRWGNPFFSGTGLTRDMNPNDILLNRARACGNVTLGPNQSCDEYPMATTHQGAAFVGPGNFSAIAVPETANSSQGGTLNNFYATFHVLDGDEFFVQVVLPNGTLAW
jgi:hypothetical protein